MAERQCDCHRFRQSITNPCDGHTQREVIAENQKLTGCLDALCGGCAGGRQETRQRSLPACYDVTSIPSLLLLDTAAGLLERRDHGSPESSIWLGATAR